MAFGQFKLTSLQWLYAPRKEAIYFTLRTTFASYLALVIALWMQMDSPRWAVMTVWVVAQTTSGETIAKAQARVAGTIVGVIIAIALVSLFPQQPAFFCIGLAIWVAICAGWGSLVRGSGAYGFVLAGYTCALVGLTAVSNPNAVFMMAMARGSYIILGVLCLCFVERFFAFNVEQKAKQTLYNNLDKAVIETLAIIVNVLKGDYKAAFQVQKIFMTVSAFQSGIEFRKIEMLHDKDHTADHINAALSSISVVLARLIHLNVYMHRLNKNEIFQRILFDITTYLESLITSIKQQKNLAEHLQMLNKLRWECRQIVADYIYYDAIARSKKEDKSLVSIIDDRILYRALSKLLGEVEVILVQYQSVYNPKERDKFTFKFPPIYNFKMAWGNAVRVFVGVLGACILWEITAWDEFPTIIGLMCVACGRLSIIENGYQLCIAVYKGALWGALVAGILDVTLMAQATNIEMVWLALFIPMWIGGLMNYNLLTRGMGIGYSVFFPYVVILGNQVRVDELTYLNTVLAMIVGVGMCTFVFLFIAPYSPQKVRKQIQHKMLHSIQFLAKVSQLPNTRRWLLMTMEWFVSLMRQFNPTKEAVLVEKYNHGALAVMCIGLNIIEIRRIIDHNALPQAIKNELRVVVRRIKQYKGDQYDRTTLIAKSAVRRLRVREKKELNVAIGLEIEAAISCLTLIYYALEKNASFLNSSYPLYKFD